MISKTLYAKYIKERENFDVLETDSSFLTYKIKENSCFIGHAYVEKSARKKGGLRHIINDLSIIAKRNGCETITGAIDLRDSGASVTLLASLKIGFKVFQAESGVILIAKKIKGE